MSALEMTGRLIFGVGLILLAVWITRLYVRAEIHHWREYSARRR